MMFLKSGGGGVGKNYEYVRHSILKWVGSYEQALLQGIYKAISDYANNLAYNILKLIQNFLQSIPESCKMEHTLNALKMVI